MLIVGRVTVWLWGIWRLDWSGCLLFDNWRMEERETWTAVSAWRV